MEQFKLKVGRCFALIPNHLGRFDLFVPGRRHFLLSERLLSFNNVMITLPSARPSARTVELASGLRLLISSLPGSASRTHVESLGKPCHSKSVLEALIAW